MFCLIHLLSVIIGCMEITAADICRTIEEKVHGAHCIVSSTGDQIAVLFDNRPDTVIHLLTPYLQMRLKTGRLTQEETDQMVKDVQNISGREALADTIIDDPNESPGTWTDASQTRNIWLIKTQVCIVCCSGYLFVKGLTYH